MLFRKATAAEYKSGGSPVNSTSFDCTKLTMSDKGIVEKTKDAAQSAADSVKEGWDKMTGNRTEDKAADKVKNAADSVADKAGDARDWASDKMHEAGRKVDH